MSFATVDCVMDNLRAAEIARFLGVTDERVRQLAARDPSFPQPVETEPHRRWDRAEVERWADEHWWGKRPWRSPDQAATRDR